MAPGLLWDHPSAPAALEPQWDACHPERAMQPKAVTWGHLYPALETAWEGCMVGHLPSLRKVGASASECVESQLGAQAGSGDT